MSSHVVLDLTSRQLLHHHRHHTCKPHLSNASFSHTHNYHHGLYILVFLYYIHHHHHAPSVSLTLLLPQSHLPSSSSNLTYFPPLSIPLTLLLPQSHSAFLLQSLPNTQQKLFHFWDHCLSLLQPHCFDTRKPHLLLLITHDTRVIHSIYYTYSIHT